MTLASDEFIRRFLIHVLPRGFHRIRHYGLFASAGRAENIARARELLHVPKPQSNPTDADTIDEALTLAHSCPCCGGRMVIIETFKRGNAPRNRPAAPTVTIRTRHEHHRSNAPRNAAHHCRWFSTGNGGACSNALLRLQHANQASTIAARQYHRHRPFSRINLIDRPARPHRLPSAAPRAAAKSP